MNVLVTDDDDHCCEKERKKKGKGKHYRDILQSHFNDTDQCVKQTSTNSKFGKYIHTYEDPNGGAKVLHAYASEMTHIKEEYLKDFAKEFLQTLFNEETEGAANYVMGIVHNAALCLPEMVNYFNETCPNLVVKADVFGRKSDVCTMKMSEYCEQIEQTYHNGTFKSPGGLLQVSLVQTVAEETGKYMPELLDMMEKDPFLNYTLPWGGLSILSGIDRRRSNDGPILWIRPGEQMIPTAEVSKSPQGKRKK